MRVHLQTSKISSSAYRLCVMQKYSFEGGGSGTSVFVICPRRKYPHSHSKVALLSPPIIRFSSPVRTLLVSSMCCCVCVCGCVAHRWCSVHPSSPGGSHTCHPGRLRGRCSVGDSPSARILDLSSLPRTDTHH